MSQAIHTLPSNRRPSATPTSIVAAPSRIVLVQRLRRRISGHSLRGLTLGLMACGGVRDDGQPSVALVATCAEVDRGRWPPGGVVVIADDPSPPCRLVLDTTVIRSYSSAEADSLDLATVREVDRHGNFYIQGYTPGVITVLTPTGDLLDRIGGEGPGPGEFPSGYLGVDVSENDSIYIHDNRRWWSVFSPERRFSRSMALGDVQSGSNVRCVLPDGAVISAALVRGGKGTATLRRIGPEGAIEREFGLPEHTTLSLSSLVLRGVTCGLDATVWALPNPHDPGYRLERWGPDGTLLNVITRTAPWFDAGPELTRTEAMAQQPHSAVRQVFEARRGLLYITIVNPDPRWEPITRDQWEARQAQMIDVRFEALDGISGRLLGVLLVDDQRTLPNARILRDGRSYQLVVSGSGAVQLVAYTLHLADP